LNFQILQIIDTFKEMILKFVDFIGISEGLKYHIENNITLSESIYRIGSQKHLELVNEVRKLYISNNIDLKSRDVIIVEKLKTGELGVYINDGKKIEVNIDLPEFAKGDDLKRHKYIVYRPSKTKEIDEETKLPKTVKIGFGHPDYEVANYDEKRRKSFLKRHQCDLKTDLYSSGWWSCNINLFWKQLKLQSDKQW